MLIADFAFDHQWTAVADSLEGLNEELDVYLAFAERDFRAPCSFHFCANGVFDVDAANVRAEDFDVAEASEPGTVMVLGEEGALAQCRSAYDKRVAGVISGAGEYRPGITLDQQPTRTNRAPMSPRSAR